MIGRAAAMLFASLALGACVRIDGSGTDADPAREVARCVAYDASGGTITCGPPADARAGDRCICTDPQAGVLYVGRVQATQ